MHNENLTREQMEEAKFPEAAIDLVLGLQDLVEKHRKDYDKILDDNLKARKEVTELNNEIVVLEIEKEAAEKIQQRASNLSYTLQRKNYWFQRRYGEPPDRRTFHMNFIQRIVAKLFRI